MLAPMVLLLLATPFLVHTRWFGRGAHDHWVQVLDYPYQATAVNADVVIFGDSAALYGVDPRIMQRDLGVRAVNLGGSINSLGVMGDKPLRSYLSRNKQPKVIVLYLAPWDTGALPESAWAEGVIMMYRHDTPANILRYAAQHPVGILNAQVFLADLVMRRLSHPGSQDGYAAFQQAANGYLPDPDVVPSLPANCTLRPRNQAPPSPGAFPRNFFSRWQSPQTEVVLYLAPIPNCAGAQALLEMPLDPAPLTPQRTLPPQYFLNDDFQVHIVAGHIQDSTRLLEEALTQAHLPAR